MMKKTYGKFLRFRAALFVAIFWTAAAGQSQAATFSYSQAGYAEGAIFSGSFEAVDLDANGQISSFSGEVSSFSGSFSGNSLIDAFTVTTTDLIGLVFDLNSDNILGNGTTGSIEGILASTGVFGFQGGAGPGPSCSAPGDACGRIDFFGDAVLSDFSSSNILVNAGAIAPVPVPGALPLMISALAGLGYLSWRRKDKNAA